MKSGFVSVIGRSNAGKSALINSLLEEKITLVSHKQNATRRKIKAIAMHKGHQLILTDTPGLHKSEKLFNQMLIQSAMKALSDCDLILFVASIFDTVEDYENFLSLKPKVPHLVVLNKIDLSNRSFVFKKLEEYSKLSTNFTALVPYSCKKRVYKNILLDELVKHLPEHEYFFDPHFLTSSSQKELFKDFILEAVFENLSEELPYSSEILISKIKDTQELLILEASIITDTNSHKAMLIGKNAFTLKRVGRAARIKISKLIGKKVLLKLFVQVRKNWQKDEAFLKKLLNYEE